MESDAKGHLKYNGHIRALDGLRGLAILLVLFHHLWPYVWDSPFYALLSKVKHVGWVGVDLFFVLSGFLITGILLDSRGQPHYFRNFIARRSLRIFPLYYFFLFLAFVAVPLLLAALGLKDTQLAANRELLPWFVCYLSNYLYFFHDSVVAGLWGTGLLQGMEQGLQTFLAVTWSLSVEEQFYLLWPAIVLVLGRRLPVAAVTICLAAVAARGIVILTVRDWAHVANMATFCRMDSLALGSLIASYVRSRNFQPGLWGYGTRIGVWLGLPVLLLWLLLSAGRSSAFFTLFGYSWSALCFACLLGYALQHKSTALKRCLESRWLTWFGKYSYGLYLYHMLVLYLVDIWRPAHTTPQGLPADPQHFQPILGNLHFDAPLRLLLVVLLTIVVTWLSFHLLERPLLGFKNRFPGHARLPSPNVAVANSRRVGPA